jgi:hypothetical protein
MHRTRLTVHRPRAQRDAGPQPWSGTTAGDAQTQPSAEAGLTPAEVHAFRRSAPLNAAQSRRPRP